jgi:hypothetical protein
VGSAGSEHLPHGSGNGFEGIFPRIREASRDRAPDSPSSSEGRTPEQLDQTENIRPDIPAGVAGWGAAGTLSLAKIRKLAKGK